MQTTKPSNQQVREFMAKRREESEPPPSPERVREMLGWHLIEAERGSDAMD